MSWFTRLKQGLQKTSSRLSEGVSTLLTHRKLDDRMVEELEELLITSDLGVKTAADLVQTLKKKRYNQDITSDEVKALFAEEIETLLEPRTQPLRPQKDKAPFVVLMLGVNGTGKTTTIGKLAKQWKDKGYKVSLVAGDTFRAAAVDQLAVWAERANVPLETTNTKDAAGLIYDALLKAKERGDDVVLIDTAGRLHTKENLMEELKKIRRVIQKIDPTAPHATVLVLDATTGQNAITQVKVFQEAVDVSGLIVTKLDGTAKGGILVAIAQQFQVPIHAIGIGEGIEDLQDFSAKDFAKSLMEA